MGRLVVVGRLGVLKMEELRPSLRGVRSNIDRAAVQRGNGQKNWRRTALGRNTGEAVLGVQGRDKAAVSVIT